MRSFLFNILRLKLFVWSLFPLRLLYGISDFLFILVYYVVGYRKKVVRRNLENSFPDKSPKEIRTLEKGFYRHFCDYMVETVKLMHISDKEMMKRFQFTNADEMSEILKDGKPVFLMIGHYGNWEWIPSITRWLPESLCLAQIYRPLSNPAADKFFLKLRSRFGSFGIPKNDTLREIIRLRKEGKQIMIGFIADQTPSKNNIHYWMQFLNQETAPLTGAEKIGRKIDANIIFLDVRKVKRGYYEATFKVISRDAKNTAEFEITEAYMHLMEQMIRRAPQYWLWTHKRWKHKREA
ncbi:MAG: lysophospholipid acyltransferase family protein [Bacteroidales bacterium]